MTELLVRIVGADGRVYFVPFAWVGMDQWIRYCAQRECPQMVTETEKR